MPADIHALEIEFAKNPSLDACIPLCEAYLEQKRFMEAMVVCKKGIKTNPADPRGRVMLARVYLAQGKQPKAQQELGQLQQEFAGHPLVLELAGELSMQQGQTDEAISQLQQALQADPSLEHAPNLLAQLGAPVPQAPQTPPQSMPQGGQPGAMPGQPGAPAQPGMGQPAQQPGMMPQPGAVPPGQQPGMPQQPAMGQPPHPQGMPAQQPGMPQPQQQPGMPPGGMGQPAAPGQPGMGGQAPVGQPGMQVPGQQPGAPGQPPMGQQPGMAGQPPMGQPPMGQQPGGPGQPPMGQPGMAGQQPMGQPGMPSAGGPAEQPAADAHAQAGQGFEVPGGDVDMAMPGGEPQGGVEQWTTPGGDDTAPPEPPPGDDPSAPEPSSGKLEHVTDFFAPDTLGFSNDSSDVETAGPGRLTIVGFVPKSTGSLKTTLFVLLGAFAVAGAYIAYRVMSSQQMREKNKLFTEIRLAMEEDKYYRYKNALQRGEKILQLDSDHALTLGAMAYAQAVLGTEHAEKGALKAAKRHLNKLGDELNEFSAPAHARVAYADGNYAQGLEKLNAKREAGGSNAIMEMEAYRLMAAQAPHSEDTEQQLKELKTAVSSETRVLNFLGWHHYKRSDWSDADRYFSKTLQRTKGHPRALLGAAVADLDRGIALQERQKEIEEKIKKVFALPSDEISQPVLALAHFVRGRLRQWQQKDDEAQKDFKKAFELDGDNAMFNYRKGVAHLDYGAYDAAIADLKKATEKAPKRVRYYKKLAVAQTRADQFDAAEATLSKAGELVPEDAEQTLLRGQLLLAKRQYDQAIETFESVKREDADVGVYIDAQMGISNALRAAGRSKKAVSHMEDLLRNVPSGAGSRTQAKLWCELGRNFEATRSRKRALESYQNGIKQFPHYPACHFYVCRLLRRGAQAQKACEKYLTLAPRGQFSRQAKRRVR